MPHRRHLSDIWVSKPVIFYNVEAWEMPYAVTESERHRTNDGLAVAADSMTKMQQEFAHEHERNDLYLDGQGGLESWMR